MNILENLENANQEKKGTMPMSSNRILPFKEVKSLTGLSRSTLWKLEKDGKFPSRRTLTSNRVGWLESEIIDWINNCPPFESNQIKQENSPAPNEQDSINQPIPTHKRHPRKDENIYQPISWWNRRDDDD
jgi:prophage regulatory protein